MAEEKKKKDFSKLGDDSGEMDVIKDVFSSAGPEDSTTDIFSQALFGGQEPAVEEEKPAPAKKEKPVKEAKPSDKSTVHVVTDHDLEQMFEEPVKEDAEEEEMPVEEKATLPFEKSPEQAHSMKEAAEPKAAERPFPEEAVEEVLEHIEERAKAGDIKPVEAPRIGAAIERIRKQIDSLEEMTGDFMSTRELKKLFQNFNIMINLIQEVMHQLEVIEKSLIEKGLLDSDDLDKW